MKKGHDIRRALLSFLVATALLAAPAAADNPTFVVGASAIVLPAKPSFAPRPTNFRHVYRVGKGIYCVAPVSSFDWSTHTPLVAPLPAMSRRRAGSLIASWDAGGQRCPAAAIQVRTSRIVAGKVNAANDVAFQILVGGND